MPRSSTAAGACLAALMLVLLPACAGVPLSTMWRMRSFDAADFAQVDPAGVRAAIQLEERLAIRAGATKLKVTLTDDAGAETPFLIPLRTLREGRSVGADLPAAGRGRRWYLFDIAPEHRADFAALQSSIRDRAGAGGGLAMEVVSGFESAPAVRRTPIEIRLQLDADDGFFTLYKGTVDLAGE